MRWNRGAGPDGRPGCTGRKPFGHRLLAAAAFAVAAATVSFPGGADPAVPPRVDGARTLTTRQVEDGLKSRLLEMRERRAIRARRRGGRPARRSLEIPPVQMPPAPDSRVPAGEGGRR
jgi:hypothetical protein